MPRRDRPDDPLTAISRFLYRELKWPAEKVLRFELAMRAEHGGKRYYVKRAPLRIVIERDPRGHKTRSW